VKPETAFHNRDRKQRDKERQRKRERGRETSTLWTEPPRGAVDFINARLQQMNLQQIRRPRRPRELLARRIRHVKARASAPGSTYFSRSGIARAHVIIYFRGTHTLARVAKSDALPCPVLLLGRYFSRTWSSLDAGWLQTLSLSLSLPYVRARP